MITEQQQEQAALFALGFLEGEEQRKFVAELRVDSELQQLVRTLQGTVDKVALGGPRVDAPVSLKDKVLRRIDAVAGERGSEVAPGFAFHAAAEPSGWKELPVKGAWIKMLSLERARGYAVLLGKLAPGVRYPAHTHPGPEELFILTGDLQIGELSLGAGDFHHSDAGTRHEDNHSLGGCTLLAVLPLEHDLVKFALA